MKRIANINWSVRDIEKLRRFYRRQVQNIFVLCFYFDEVFRLNDNLGMAPHTQITAYGYPHNQGKRRVNSDPGLKARKLDVFVDYLTFI